MWGKTDIWLKDLKESFKETWLTISHIETSSGSYLQEVTIRQYMQTPESQLRAKLCSSDTGRRMTI